MQYGLSFQPCCKQLLNLSMEWVVTLADLDRFARQFWTSAGRFTLFAFHGEMGAGKTTVISALARALGVHSGVSSPTFSIINEYGYTENGESKTIYHIDLYRLKDREEIEGAGIEECISTKAICFVEWPEKAPYLFDEKALHIFIELVDFATRRIKIISPTIE